METSDENQANAVKLSSTKAMTLRINPWWLSALLTAGLVAMLLLWHPWDAAPSNDARTVSVSGSTTLKAEPDEYVFYPSYEFKNADKAAGLTELTAKSDEVVAGLKKAGVADKDIKTGASGYRDYYYFDQESKTHTYTLQITATTHDRDAAQKAQDYLATTDPSGAVTPEPTFSEATRKKLESKGRDAATKDARAKAEQQAKNLGFSIGKVKSVSDSDMGYGYPVPMVAETTLESSGTDAKKSLTVQPGQNELTYTVQVTYYIK